MKTIKTIKTIKKAQRHIWKFAVSLACLTLLIFVGSALADNTGSGGTIVYTDSNGLNPVTLPPYVGGYVVHTFTANGTLTLPSSVSADVLVVAGGGGGGARYAGGGGAGGLIYTNISLSGGAYSATIGAGGAGGVQTSLPGGATGTSGNNSDFNGILIALGGGGGGVGYVGGGNSIAGLSGGSGGGSGGAAPFQAGGAATQPTSASGGFGNPGGSGPDTSSYGGGGGAGAAGGTLNGGNGLQYNISGVNSYYAGGGGGIVGGTNGLGGGGKAGASNQNGFNGVANTGGGGGGAFGNSNGGAGGSGIIIVRYPYNPGAPTITLTSPTNSAAFVGGTSISATASALGGSTPYSVTYHYKLTSAGSYTATTAVGPFGATNTFNQTLGTLPNGVYQVYASVTDNAASTVNSTTNTFTVYAAGNTGQGGVITYTDSNGLNPVSGPAYVGGYVVQTFTSNGTFVLPYSISADVLVVAGGGGAGGAFGGGGGAGGLVYSNLSLNAGSINVTVGAGGGGYTGGSINTANAGTNGGNSIFGPLTVLGGGGGGGGYDTASSGGQAGGSGGGGHSSAGAGAATQPASASGGFGNDGFGYYPENAYGGGGGAGAAATDSAGGIGLQNAISGVNNYYAGGGGGISANGTGEGVGGLGGGGNGATGSGPGNSGTANTGGGGGAGWGAASGSGGSGIVIVRYPYSANPPVSVTMSSPTSGQQFLLGSSISATALVAGGTPPYSVTYHYKLTTAGSYTATTGVGPFGSTNNFSKTLGTLPAGVYQLYATVADSISGTASSATNTFTVFTTGNTGSGGTIVYTDPSGLNPVSSPPYVGGYVVQTFTANGTLTLPSSVSADVLVVAGGGGGGGPYGDGGGAGGLIYTNLSLSAGVYTASVGAGGLSGYNTNGANGNNSVLGALTALGGGGGGAGNLTNNAPGQNGGSGGGGGGTPFDISGFDAGVATQPSSASGGFGNNGYTPGDGSLFGGGGGAGVAPTSEAGGDGLPFAISGVTNYYGGGGGGCNGVGTGGLGGGGSGGAAPGPSAGSSGAANTGGGGGGGLNREGGSGGSGIIIVRYPYAASSALSVAVTSPTGQSFLYGSSVAASAFVAGGTAPYSVTYHYKLTTDANYTATAAVGPSYAPSTFTQTLGAFSVVGTYQVYATVTDGAAGTATSTTNTITVSLTAGVAVQDGSFETPVAPFFGTPQFWAHIAPVWNSDNTNPFPQFQQNSLTLSPQNGIEHFHNVCPGGGDWYALINANTISITQDLLTSVNVGDTISLSFYGGRGLTTSSTTNGGVFTATFLVGSTPYSMPVDVTVLPNGTWQSYTLTQVLTNSGELSLQFSAVSGDPWLDNISVTRTIPSPGSVPPILGAPKALGGNLIVTGTGGTPNAGYTWLSTTNLSAPIIWITNSTGTLDGAGALSNSIPIGTNPASFYRLRLP